MVDDEGRLDTEVAGAVAVGTPRSSGSAEPDERRAVGTLDTTPASVATMQTLPVTPSGGRAIPTKLGRFVILRTLGAGGMGTVYEAHDPELDRKVALKLVRADVHDASPEATRRALHREAKAMAKVEHPNVITVFDVGTIEEQLYIAMELVGGGDLRKWMTADKRSWQDVLRMCLQAGTGLAAAHSAGLVHRDFKPDNVLVGQDGRARVTDFGIARVGAVDDNGQAAPAQRTTPLDPALRLTRTGAIVGTPAYMAPEQHLGERADARADQFAFCVTVWEALFGERPFAGNTYAALADAVLEGNLREPPRTSVPARIVTALRRGLSVDPAARFGSMTELLAVLTPQRSRTWMVAALAAAGVLGIGGTALALTTGHAPPVDPCTRGASHLGGVWDPITQARIRGMFLASHKTFAEDAWRGVQHALDGFSSKWVSQYQETCQAARGHAGSAASVDPRMWCLDDRLREARALAETLIAADGATVARATDAANKLPDVEMCADARTTSQLMMPRDRSAQERIDAMRVDLARAMAMQTAGKFDDAVALLHQVVDAARREAYPPVEAEALLRLARAQFTLDGNAKDAEKTALAGLLAAEQGHHDYERANAWLLLTYLQGTFQARFDDAERSSEHAAAVIHGLTGADALEGRRLGYRGQILTMQGKLEDAEKSLQQGVDLIEKSGPDRPDLPQMLSRFADVVRQRGDLPRARAIAERAYMLHEHIYGPRHPETAKALFSVALAYEDEGNLDEAATRLEKAIEIFRDAFGPDHANLGPATDELGLVRKKQGRLPEALELHQRALAIREKVYGPDNPETALSLGNVARVLEKLGRQKEALPLAERALAIGLEAFGPDGPEASDGHALVGNLQLELGKFQPALDHFRLGLVAAEKAFGPTAPQLSMHQSGIGDCLLALGKAREALTWLERALTQRGDDHDSFDTAENELSLARALVASHGDRKRARKLAELARPAYQAIGRTDVDAVLKRLR